VSELADDDVERRRIERQLFDITFVPFDVHARRPRIRARLFQ